MSVESATWWQNYLSERKSAGEQRIGFCHFPTEDHPHEFAADCSADVPVRVALDVLWSEWCIRRAICGYDRLRRDPNSFSGPTYRVRGPLPPYEAYLTETGAPLDLDKSAREQGLTPGWDDKCVDLRPVTTTTQAG